MTVQREDWTEETAMEILQHPTVDSKLWAEAVEWLLLYGPPQIRELLQQASGHATKESFPELSPVGFAPDGSPCYSVEDLAAALDISVDEAARIIAEKEEAHGLRQLFGEDETSRLQ